MPLSGERLSGERLSGERPLTARSVLASTLLGTDPPRLPVSFLVRTAALFGLADGTVRTALSRMVVAGEVTNDGDGWYSLSGALVDRQDRQQRSRAADTNEWNGRWRMAVVGSGARPADERAALRRAMVRLRFAELREGVWLRPDNLGRPDDLDASGSARDDDRASTDPSRRCNWFTVDPEAGLERSDADLAAELWDLDAWADRANELRRSMHSSTAQLERGDRDALAPGFVLSAAVLRLFGGDPLLPPELLPRHWPGAALRREYDRYDAIYRTRLRAWSGASGSG